jgi:shikimate dehydrogenase
VRITGAARVAGIVGAPVAHSLSPLLHNSWLEAAGIDGVSGWSRDSAAARSRA